MITPRMRISKEIKLVYVFTATGIEHTFNVHFEIVLTYNIRVIFVYSCILRLLFLFI